MKALETEVEGVLVLEPRLYSDFRGFFMESWNRNTFEAIGIGDEFVQDNHSRSRAGTLRGLHYQLTRPQGKLVRVARGAVFDVAVDLRRQSRTFGKWTGRELSERNHRMLWVPPGCAHGFYALEDAEFLYKCTDYYAAGDEHTIRWDDAELAVAWPIEPDRPLLMSEKDRAGVAFRDAETYA